MRMGPEQAQRIVHAIILGLYAAEDVGGEVPAWLEEVTLREMLLAKRIVERTNKREAERDGGPRSAVLPDDRLITAIYTMLHWQPQPTAIACDGRGRAVAVVRMSKPKTPQQTRGEAANDG